MWPSSCDVSNVEMKQLKPSKVLTHLRVQSQCVWTLNTPLRTYVLHLKLIGTQKIFNMWPNSSQRILINITIRLLQIISTNKHNGVIKNY